MEHFQLARKNMVTNQLMTHHVLDTEILDIMKEVPRHQFVEGKWVDVAYVDMEMPLGDGRVLLKPEVLGRMIQAAGIQKTDIVLDVACGTGYSTAIISRLCSEVIAVDSVVPLTTKAKNLLAHFKVNNAFVFCDNLFAGHTKAAPYDVIIVNGALDIEPPKNLLDQLSGEGGRLVAPVVGKDGICKVMLYEKMNGNISKSHIADAYASKITN